MPVDISSLFLITRAKPGFVTLLVAGTAPCAEHISVVELPGQTSY